MHPLLDAFERNVAAFPDHPAVRDRTLTLNYERLCAVAAGLSKQISRQTKRQQVGIMAPTSAAGAAAILACWYAGKTPVPLNFLLGPEALEHVVRDAGLDFVLATEHCANALAPLNMNVLLLNAESLRPDQTQTPAADPDDLAVIIYTSGTSGLPKGVCLSFDNITSNATACIEHARMNSDQVFLSVIPQFHSFGFTAGTVIPLVLGATVCYLPRFSPAGLIDTIAEQHVTILIAIASMYGALIKMKSANAEKMQSLELLISGGEPLSAKIAQTFKQRYGKEIMDGYGLTESSPVVAVNLPWAKRSGSVGRPLPGIEVCAIDQNGVELPPQNTGELVISGHCVMQGYHNLPDETARAVRNGRLFTGDVGKVDADGYIHITGRVKEMMIVGGENVFPIEIESVLCEHPDVLEAAVIGMPDDLRGELPLAFVILDEQSRADEQLLRGFCRERLAGYMVPREIRIKKDLPRGPTGKILKRALSITPEQ